MDEDKFIEMLRLFLLDFGYLEKTVLKSVEQQVEEFISKGDESSFFEGLNIIDDWFFEELSIYFDIKYPYDIEGSPCYVKNRNILQIVWQIFFPRFNFTFNIEGKDITIADLKEAIKLGHWSFKYCNPELISENKTK